MQSGLYLGKACQRRSHVRYCVCICFIIKNQRLLISSIVNLFDSDKSKYVRKKGPGPDNVLVLNGMMKNGQPITVNVAANKNNKALDVLIGDAWLDIEGQLISIGESRHTKKYPHCKLT